MRIYQLSNTMVPIARKGLPTTKHHIWLRFYSQLKPTNVLAGKNTSAFASCAFASTYRDSLVKTYGVWWPKLYITTPLGQSFAKIFLTRLEKMHWQYIIDDDLDKIPTEIFDDGKRSIAEKDSGSGSWLSSEENRWVSDHYRWKMLDVPETFFDDLAIEYDQYEKKCRYWRWGVRVAFYFFLFACAYRYFR